MKNNNQYTDSINRLGRLSIIGAIIIMLGIPTILCAAYDIFPKFSVVLKSSSGLLALFTPLLISEVFSYTPILGSASYITFITGNIMNLKLPCALNAMNIVGVTQGSEEGDAVATLAVAVSSILTIVIIIVGLALLVPLQPLLQQPSVQIATSYMLPALFGGLMLGTLTSSGGDYVVKGKLYGGIVPFMLVFILNFFVPLDGLQGILILIMIPITIGISRFLYKRGIISVIKKESTYIDSSQKAVEVES